MDALVIQVNLVFQALQGLTTLHSQQTERLQQLVIKLCSMSGIHGPLPAEDIMIADPESIIILSPWSVSYESIHGFVLDQGSFASNSVQILAPEEYLQVQKVLD